MNAFIARKGLEISHNIEDYPDGILIAVDKPYRWTSADVIRKVKWAAGKHFGKKNIKVGHAGTLDPLATGILIVCIGKATKLAEELQRSPKQYIAGVSFGATTPSFDLEKEIDRDYPLDKVSEDALRATLGTFIGEQMQVAPLFSAKSVDGVRAYEMARKLLKQGNMEAGDGILQSSLINIYDLELLSYKDASAECTIPSANPEDINEKNNRIHVADISGHTLVRTEILVDCSKGTYIRALARDLGEALDTGAFLHSLRRTKNGPFSIDDALTMEEVAVII